MANALIGMGFPALSFTVNVTVGFWPGAPLVTLVSVKFRPGMRLRLVGDGVRAQDGGVEFELTLRDVALCALGVVGLRQIDVVGAGGEIDIVVAGAAGGAAGSGEPGVGLRGLVGGIVACLAATHVGREHHRRKVVNGVLKADDLVRLSGDARWAASSPCGSCG